MNSFHGRELKGKASFFKWEKSKWINSVILSLKCVNFNITVSLVETLFCQKFSNQSYTQQQLVKMAAVALKAVPVAQGSLASDPVSSLLCLWGAAAAASMGGCGQILLPAMVGALLPLRSCLQSPYFPSFATLQVSIISYSVSYQKSSFSQNGKPWHLKDSHPAQLLKSKEAAREAHSHPLEFFNLHSMWRWLCNILLVQCIKWNESTLNKLIFKCLGKNCWSLEESQEHGTLKIKSLQSRRLFVGF